MRLAGIVPKCGKFLGHLTLSSMSAIGDKMTWQTALLTERERNEVEFNSLYAKKFAHGTDGHNARLIIAKLSGFLDYIEWLTEQDDDRLASITSFLKSTP